MRHTTANGPSQRQLRVGEELRHSLAAILLRGELHDPDLAGVSITVSEVRPSPDMKHATVFVTTLNGDKMDVVLPALRRAASFLRGQVAKAVRLRHTPQLSFQADTSFDYAQKINTLLHQDVIARDLSDDEEDPSDGKADDADGA
ncbi:30S ribosome-binding factor RbfA [Mycobacterium sp. KBS0706]|uniref:30S ribosome-binding factor RbfA n=1 Tax=Mycobacterium sp. KBS0706 TaxID=2578109 RepID=UPI00110F9A57|nr:30S ribosome-binding factor RbfA [Mycobacterium sp. KBS0706]TSD85077.1 30S ribosome-binding factor RbfA [Mycobacterium sp. KBS0706]